MDNSFTPRPEHTSPGTQTHGEKRRGSPTNTHLIHRVLHDYPGTVHTTLPKQTFPSQSPIGHIPNSSNKIPPRNSIAPLSRPSKSHPIPSLSAMLSTSRHCERVLARVESSLPTQHQRDEQPQPIASLFLSHLTVFQREKERLLALCACEANVSQIFAPIVISPSLSTLQFQFIFLFFIFVFESNGTVFFFSAQRVSREFW